MSKLDELKEKFEEVIESLKSKLKRGGKSNDEDEEDEEEVDAEESTSEVDINEITKKASKKVKADAEDDEEEEDDDKTDPKKVAPTDKEKKKQLMIRVGLGIVVLYLAADQFILTESTDELPVVQEIKPKRPKRKKKPKTEVGQESVAAPEAQATPPENNATTAAQPVDIPPETPAEVMKTPEETAEPVVAETPTEVPTPAMEQPEIVEPPSMGAEETPPVVTEPQQVIEEPTPTATATEPEQPAVAETTILDDPTPAVEASTGQQDEMSKEIDTLVDNVEEPKKDPIDKMNKMLGGKADFIAPPTFERTGRGLVYNCTGKHWACVDKLSYFQCRGNEVWSKQNKKNPECVIKNVYASDKDCEAIQGYYVKFNEPTGFCTDSTPTKTQVEETDLNM